MSILNELQNLCSKLKTMHAEWYVLTGLLFLSVVGVGITDAAEGPSHWYWMFMVPVFFGACLYIEWDSARDSEVSTRLIVYKQSQHWLGLLVCVYLVFFLRDIGSLNNQTTGLILLLLFALATFLAGVTMGWLFRLLGIFLGLSVFIVARMEHYFWLIFWIAILTMPAYHFTVKYFGRTG